MDIHEVFQSIGQGAYVGLTAAGEGIKKAAVAVTDWFFGLPWPTSIKLFGNDTANKILFFGIAAYILYMNVYALVLFGADKAYAKRKQRRIQEKKLMKTCIFGGAIGGIIGINVFHHKTLKKKFTIGVPILFILQLVIDSFILGFVGFWTFF